MPDDDASLLRLYVESHSEPAFSALVQRHVDFVYTTALRRVGGDSSRAKDVTQIVFTDLAKKANELIGRPVIAGWLFLSTRYAAAELLRKERRRERHEREAAETNELLAPVSALVDWERLRPVLDDVLAELSEIDREAVLRRCVTKKSFAEIGDMLKITEDAARKRVSRSLEKLQQLLERRGITSTAAALAMGLGNESLIAAPPAVAALVASGSLAQCAASWPMTLKIMAFLKTNSLTMAALLVGAFVLTVRTTARTSLSEAQINAAAESPNPASPPVAASLEAAAAPIEQIPGTGATERAAATGDNRPPGKEITVREARRLMEDNAFRESLVARARPRLDFLYGPLFRKIHLTAEQREQLKDLLIEKQQGRSDAANVARSKAVQRKRDSETFFEVVSANQNTTDRSIETLLGTAGYLEYLEYERSFPARTTANMLSVQLSKTNEPMTANQLELLVIAIARTTARKGSFAGLTSQVGAGLFPLPVVGISPQAIEEAASFLSPSQLSELQDLQKNMSKNRVSEKNE